MLTGFVLPGGSATEQLEQAVLAERSGWDGVFVWEAAYGVDAWRRPWKVASQVATVDQLSGGRAILAVGVGAVDTGLPDTGEETDKRLRAERLDEGIDLLRTLWDGGLSYHGSYYDFGGRDGGPDDARAVRAWLAEHGAGPDLDVVAEGETPAGDQAAASAHVTPWARAGCTWWIENRWQMPE